MKHFDNYRICLLYTSDAADDLLCVDLGGRRIIKKKKKGQAATAELQGQVPELIFDLMNGGSVAEGAGQHVENLWDEGLQQFGLESGQGFCDAHEWASVQDKVSVPKPPYPTEALLAIPQAAVTPPRRIDYVT